MRRSRFRRTRFAPSPTGFLHAGHLASALYVWGLARAHGAEVFLRIEDHDAGRSRREYTEAIMRDLDWVGLDWANDTGSDAPRSLDALRTSAGPFTQSSRLELYEWASARLDEQGLLYACSCSRREVQQRMQQEGADENELHYTGECRDKGLPLAQDVGWRVRMPDAAVTFDDLIVGERTQRPARQCGDLLIRDRHGNWTYQFAVVVDDLFQDMDLVVRGQDLLESTGRQIALGRMLGRSAPPAFAHHRLLLGGDGRKLSKRAFSAAIAKDREAGVAPEVLLGGVAHALGWQDANRPVRLDQCLEWVVREGRRHAAADGSLSGPPRGKP